MPGFSDLVERSRATLRARIRAALPGKEYAGVIVALVVGDQRAIGQSDWKVFNRTGISHLVSISGLHITMVAGLFAWLASSLWRRSFFTSAQLPLILPAQKVAALAGAGVALLYVLLAGFGIPAQRTLYMLTVVAAALWFGRITSVSHVLCTALGVVVLLDPWAVLAPGFWLSFGAVAVILYATIGPHQSRAKPAWQPRLRIGAHTQYVVTVGLVPLTMLLFSQVSLVSPIANAVAIPLVSFIVTPLSLAGSLLPAPLVQHPARHSPPCHGGAGIASLSWLGDMRFAVWTRAGARALDVRVRACRHGLDARAARLAGALDWPGRLAAAAGQLPTHPHDGRDARHRLRRGAGHGPAGRDQRPPAAVRYRPVLFARIEWRQPGHPARTCGRAASARLDGIIVSHSDVDHAGGALAILDAVKAGWVAVVALVRPPDRQGGRRRTAAVWRDKAGPGTGSASTCCIPSPASYADTGLKPNARSCTLRITAGRHSILLAAISKRRRKRSCCRAARTACSQQC